MRRLLPAIPAAVLAAGLAAGLAAALPGIGGAQAQTTTRSSPKAVLPDLPLSILQTLAYVDIAPGRALTLENGTHRDEARTLRLVGELLAHGDLDGDGTSDAAVLLEETRAGETATTLHLAIVVQRAGRVRNMASLRLGPDVQVRSLAVATREALLELLVMGEGDAPGRPTLKMALALKLQGSEVLVMRQEPGGKFAPADLAGTAWRLAAAAQSVAVEFAPGDGGGLRLSGRAYCHRFAAGMDGEGRVLSVAAGAAIASKMLCPPEAARAERAFLAALAASASLAFRYGRLALEDGQGGAMVWEPARAQP